MRRLTAAVLAILLVAFAPVALAQQYPPGSGGGGAGGGGSSEETPATTQPDGPPDDPGRPPEAPPDSPPGRTGGASAGGGAVFEEDPGADGDQDGGVLGATETSGGGAVATGALAFTGAELLGITALGLVSLLLGTTIVLRQRRRISRTSAT
jgi:hypothetical protein